MQTPTTDISIYQARAKIAPSTPEEAKEVVSTLSILNKQLDAILAHKNAKLRPALDTVNAIRADYREIEQQLTTLIATYKAHLTHYATLKEKEEQAILNDKRTTPETKIQKLSTLTPATAPLATEEGKITFTTITKYRLSDTVTQEEALNLLKEGILVLDMLALKNHLKTSPLPAGIESYEEKSIRNYRTP